MLTKDEERKMKMKMKMLQGPPMTVQTLTRTRNPTNLLKCPLAPVNELLPKLMLPNQRIGIITLI